VCYNKLTIFTKQIYSLKTKHTLTRIGLISDTHGYLDEAVFDYFKDCDEIWHAGDFGENDIADSIIAKFPNKIFRGVYGNIDSATIRNIYPEKLFFTIEDVRVFMIHIGGYPGRYSKGVKDEIIAHKSNLFISGHSHILKIIYDNKLECLYMNAGAAGKQGWHKVRTIIRFSIDGNNMKDCEVIELEK
jgi:uncharacterized protein